ncbi:MAG TPA: hypothetical protein VLG46_08675 [Anaerolineae bacterium]|nr:hypothetical protein [Anaerolineae bacterium]
MLVGIALMTVAADRREGIPAAGNGTAVAVVTVAATLIVVGAIVGVEVDVRVGVVHATS